MSLSFTHTYARTPTHAHKDTSGASPLGRETKKSTEKFYLVLGVFFIELMKGRLYADLVTEREGLLDIFLRSSLMAGIKFDTSLCSRSYE